ncbi:MAG: hypothetical protein V3W41_05015 [Planctomycetota bacterium]
MNRLVAAALVFLVVSCASSAELPPINNNLERHQELIDDPMTRFSCYEHSQSQETPSFLPEEPELRHNLESLKEWREEFKGRPTEASA